MSRLRALRDHGQAPWLDYIDRRLLDSGGLAALVDDGLTGVTSNPSIFRQAIGSGDGYEEPLRRLVEQDGTRSALEIYEELAVRDIRDACDVLAPVWEEAGGDDGFVSLEVSPHLAADTEGTVAEARRLWQRVERPNLMIKVPATAEGIPAIETLTAEGVSVNVTLMFSMAHYEAVAEAYLRGLERADDPAKVASVASFFVSRVDSRVDPLLEALETPEADELEVRSLLGKVAIANSKAAYGRFREIFGSERFQALAERGARVQRLLWGSTSTKNPAYPDLLYVETLIGPQTVNTLPPKTLEVFRQRGEVRPTVGEGLEAEIARLDLLGDLDIDLWEIGEDLQREGVEAFARAFDELLATVEERRRSLLG